MSCSSHLRFSHFPRGRGTAEIEDFTEGFNQPTYRGVRVNGVGWLPGHPEMGGLAIAGRMRSGSTSYRLSAGENWYDHHPSL
jgi:hypothetical protein